MSTLNIIFTLNRIQLTPENSNRPLTRSNFYFPFRTFLHHFTLDVSNYILSATCKQTLLHPYFYINYDLNLQTAEFLALGLCDFGETLLNTTHECALYVAERFSRKNAGNSRISTQAPKRRGTITTWYLLPSPKILCYAVDWSIRYPCYMLDLGSK